jgi:hypothetical protein
MYSTSVIGSSSAQSAGAGRVAVRRVARVTGGDPGSKCCMRAANNSPSVTRARRDSLWETALRAVGLPETPA